MTQPDQKHPNPTPTLRESLAAVQHEIWSHWTKYLFSKCNVGGMFVISSDLVQRWMRQMNTGYFDLLEQEKESDRHQADKILAVLDELDEGR